MPQSSQIDAYMDTAPRRMIPVDAAGAAVVIVKFNDYQCPPCGRPSTLYKPLKAKWDKEAPGKVKFVTKDFPLEGECNATHPAAAPTCSPARRRRPSAWPARTARPRRSRTGSSPTSRRLTLDGLKQAVRDIGGVADFDAQYPKVLGDVEDRHRRWAASSASARRRRSSSTASRCPTPAAAVLDAAIELRAEEGRSSRPAGSARPAQASSWRRFPSGARHPAMRNRDARAHQGLPRRLLAAASVPRARRPDARGRARRGVRLPRPQRRRQDHHAEAADAAGLPDRRARATILGRPVGDVDVKRRIGYLPENPYFYDYLTAEELLDVLRRPVRLHGARSGRTRVARLLDEVGLGAERRLQLRKFSKGMIQRVGLAQALINDPEVVFLDEPMSGLDPLGRRDVRAADPAAARRGPHRLLQLAHPVRRRDAVQPRRDRRAGPADGVGHARRLLAVRSSGLGDRRRWPAPGAADARVPRSSRARQVTAHRRASATRSTSPPTADPMRLAARSLAARRPPGLAQPGPRDARGLLRAPGRRGGGTIASSAAPAARRRRRAAGGGGRRMTAMATVLRIAANVFRESVRDKVLYSIVLFAVLLIARVASARPAHRRPGRQDHQGPRPRRDLALRPLHRHLHRHRPGVEGGRAAQHLRAAGQADDAARSSSSASTSAWCSTLAVNVGGDDGGALSPCSPSTAGRRRPTIQAAWEAPALDPALLKAVVLILVELRWSPRSRCSSRPSPARCCRRRSPSACSSPATSAPTCKNFEQVVESPPVAVAGARRSTTCCRTSRRSTSRRRSCTRSRCAPATWR